MIFITPKDAAILGLMEQENEKNRKRLKKRLSLEAKKLVRKSFKKGG